MFTNADCTVFNRKLNKETRTDVWYKSYIRGVYWEDTKSVKYNDNKNVSNESTLFVSIPSNADTVGKSYVKPNEYKAASAEAAFTFAIGDIIMKGIISENIDSSTTVKDLQQKYDDYHVITECADYRFGGLPHLEVSGK